MPTSRTSYKTGRRVTNYRRTPTSTSTQKTGWSYMPTQYKNAQCEIQWRIGSYRNINSQFTGAGKVTAFSPTVANRWIKYVNSGMRVYKFKSADFYRHFGNQWQNATPTATARWLKQKYGAGIKAVTRGKANCWLVAANERVSARPFGNYYNWR
ncbi:MAG: hypothetical protein KKB50_12975 [Planctomycetes bacterium]|nr:hypothetical protein [Planctomycetota bacterium]